MVDARARGTVHGFTTNPTLMRKAGITDYKAFAHKAIAAIPDLPISFEVFSDDFETMEREAREIASWGGDTYVKIPITNTKGESAAPLIRKLSKERFSLNVTAMFTLDQVETVAAAVDAAARTIVSVFAGRIADTGVDPVPLMTQAVEILKPLPKAELLWASPREVLNVVQAEECGCHIITATPGHHRQDRRCSERIWASTRSKPLRCSTTMLVQPASSSFDRMQPLAAARRRSISVIVPVYKEERNIRPFLERPVPILERLGTLRDHLLSRSVSRPHRGGDPRGDRRATSGIGLLVFSRRFGQPAATMAGILNCRGALVRRHRRRSARPARD